jgi:carboxymethylenebutenolidase
VAGTNPDIKAAVAWYGSPTRPFPDTPNPVTGFDLAKDIKAPFLGLNGETDQNPTPADARKLVEMLKLHNPTAEAVIYPGAGHAFFADYRPSYNATAAADGWKRCVAHFDKHLRPGGERRGSRRQLPDPLAGTRAVGLRDLRRRARPGSRPAPAVGRICSP